MREREKGRARERERTYTHNIQVIGCLSFAGRTKICIYFHAATSPDLSRFFHLCVYVHPFPLVPCLCIIIFFVRIFSTNLNSNLNAAVHFSLSPVFFSIALLDYYHFRRNIVCKTSIQVLRVLEHLYILFVQGRRNE